MPFDNSIPGNKPVIIMTAPSAGPWIVRPSGIGSPSLPRDDWTISRGIVCSPRGPDETVACFRSPSGAGEGETGIATDFSESRSPASTGELDETVACCRSPSDASGDELAIAAAFSESPAPADTGELDETVTSCRSPSVATEGDVGIAAVFSRSRSLARTGEVGAAVSDPGALEGTHSKCIARR